MHTIISDRNTFTVKGVKFLFVKTSNVNGLWEHTIKNLDNGKRSENVPDHKIRKYL